MLKYENKTIKNIYYMLAYVLMGNERELSIQPPDAVFGNEEFVTMEDFLTKLLLWGVGGQLKQGLCREYITVNESLAGLRGRLDFNGTIAHRMRRQPLLACEHDEYSENITLNRIIKTTMWILVRHNKVSHHLRERLMRLLPYFGEVDLTDLHTVQWATLRIPRNYRYYKLIIYVCYLLYRGLLFSDEGSMQFHSIFKESELCRIYELFLYSYFKHHFGKQVEVYHGKQIEWDLQGGDYRYLPSMISDVMLKHRDKTLIIDAKFYKEIFQQKIAGGASKYTSAHLYQIYSYVCNYANKTNQETSGMLLYAKTDNEPNPGNPFYISGHSFCVKALDLNQDFANIALQLNSIVKDYFGI